MNVQMYLFPLPSISPPERILGGVHGRFLKGHKYRCMKKRIRGPHIGKPCGTIYTGGSKNVMCGHTLNTRWGKYCFEHLCCKEGLIQG